MRNLSRDKVTPPVIRIIITVFDIVVFVDIHRNWNNVLIIWFHGKVTALFIM